MYLVIPFRKNLKYALNTTTYISKDYRYALGKIQKMSRRTVFQGKGREGNLTKTDDHREHKLLKFLNFVFLKREKVALKDVSNLDGSSMDVS